MKRVASKRNLLPLLCSKVWVCFPELIMCSRHTAQTPQSRHFSWHFHCSFSSAGQGRPQHFAQRTPASITCVLRLWTGPSPLYSGAMLQGAVAVLVHGSRGLHLWFIPCRKSVFFPRALAWLPSCRTSRMSLATHRQLSPACTIFSWFSLLLPYPMFADSIQIRPVPCTRMALWIK